MAFHITHRYGSMEAPPSTAAFPELLRELDERPEDMEHSCVSVTHESEWSLSVSRGGHIFFEHLEEGLPRYMQGVADVKILELWARLSEGDIAAIEREPWRPGYGP